MKSNPLIPASEYADIDCGVVTASDSAFFPGVMTLLRSLATRDVPVYVFDLGLTASQRRKLTEFGAAVACPAFELIRDVPFWQTWNKPRFVLASPFACTLWLDADCLVVGDLDPLFVATTCKPLILQHWRHRRYQWPTGDVWRLMQAVRPQDSLAVNAGVLGFMRNRDTDFVTEWMSYVNSVVACDAVREGCPWADDSVLNVLLSRDEHRSKITARDDSNNGWNKLMPASFHYGDTPEQFSKIISRTTRPDDVVLHFSGGARARYWHQWETHNGTASSPSRR